MSIEEAVVVENANKLPDGYGWLEDPAWRSRLPAEIEAPYPKVVVRYMAAVYGELRVVFVAGAEPPDVKGGYIAVIDPTPEAQEHNDARLTALISLVKRAVARRGFRMCIVLAKDCGLFVERDGSLWLSRSSPRGGAKLDRR